MISQIFSVFDTAVQAFLPPFFARSKGEAIRSFMEACRDPNHQFSRHSGDYVLYSLGEFDDGSGAFVVPNPQRIVSALECSADAGPGSRNGDKPERLPPM